MTLDPASADASTAYRSHVDDVIAALGGQKFLEMRDRVETGRAYSFYREQLSGLATAKVSTRYLPPGKPGEIAIQERQAFGKDLDSGAIFTGDKGWQFSFRGARPMPPETYERFRFTTLNNIFYIFRQRLNEPIGEDTILNLSELGFLSRHHIDDLSAEDHLELEVEIGSRLLKQAALANGWEPADVQGVLIGMSGPVSLDYVERISKRAGIPESALMVSVHKACDGSMGALHLSLNPELSTPGQTNVAEELAGKKVLVGGIEGVLLLEGARAGEGAVRVLGGRASEVQERVLGLAGAVIDAVRADVGDVAEAGLRGGQEDARAAGRGHATEVDRLGVERLDDLFGSRGVGRGQGGRERTPYDKAEIARAGARHGGGCTSGHGICGVARLSARSIVATAIFIFTAIAVVAIMRHGFGA